MFLHWMAEGRTKLCPPVAIHWAYNRIIHGFLQIMCSLRQDDFYFGVFVWWFAVRLFLPKLGAFAQ